MLLQEAIALAQEMIGTRQQHCYYDRVVDLAKKYKALITGENAEVLLTQFVRRENDEAFQQRLALTILITPAVCSALSKPFNKVSWNKKVKKFFEFDTEQRNANVQKMREVFYGRKKSKNKGLDYWLKVRYPDLSLVDPNSWVVIEWDSPETQAEIIKPRPFEVTSEMAWDYSVVNEEIKWLWVHQDIGFRKLIKTEGQKIKEARNMGLFTIESGNKWTLYDSDYTIVCTQIDREYLKSINYKLAKNEMLWDDPVSKKSYSVKTFEPKLGFPPVFRTGWKRDPETEGETFVNGWHEAMPYLMKSVKTVSEMDLTMSLHAFPQKMQYVKNCPGDRVRKISCLGGVDATGAQCKICKGAGHSVHTSAQDALFFPFPAQGTTNAELLDLEKLLVYRHPPTELLEFQNKYIESLKTSCHYAVYGQTALTKANSSGTAGNGPVTATESGINYEGVWDAIRPFSEKVSDVWVDSIFTFGVLAGLPESEYEDSAITCVFPPNPQMKSMNELLLDLKAANESGAPSFLKDAINNDIAELLYEGDAVAETIYWVKHQFYPFNGQTSDEIALNMASQYVNEFQKVLYANFEAIFSEIEMEHPDFWYMKLPEQWKLVEEKVGQYQEEIDSNKAPDLMLTVPPSFPDNNKDDNNSGDGTTNEDEETPASPEV